MMLAEPTTPGWRSRDWSDPAANVLFIFGVLSLFFLEPSGVLLIWFGVRIRQRRDGFRQTAAFVIILNVVLIPIVLLAQLFSREPRSSSIPELSLLSPLAETGLFLLVWITFCVHGAWLTAPGTMKAHWRQTQRKIPPEQFGRPAFWVPLLRLAHAPLLLVALLLLVSIGRPGMTNPQAPPGGGGRWAWMNDRIRYERWDPPFTVPGSYTWEGGNARGDIVVVQQHVMVSGGAGGMQTVNRGSSYELRLIPGLIYAAVTTALAILIEVMWRWKLARPEGLCRVCGYDLRATPDRCPECGTEIKRRDPEATETDAEQAV